MASVLTFFLSFSPEPVAGQLAPPSPSLPFSLSPLTLTALLCLSTLLVYQAGSLLLGVITFRRTVNRIPGPESSSILLGHLALMREIRNNVTSWYQRESFIDSLC